MCHTSATQKERKPILRMSPVVNHSSILMKFGKPRNLAVSEVHRILETTGVAG
ncbi:hypothetical protein T4E_832 [Trichinella pseudospiralis]|uniref:Uncharacterized protein n=1 Tax=Trichinella pseudospiralis TaxID=6337 RepID=A0A0V0XZ53_TRIPS|nr:hypothetical protein T4E_832 [Trichinella pseudospiralis]